MTGNDQPSGQPAGPAAPGGPGQPHVSRRSLLGVAGVGAAGLAAGAFGAAAPALAAAGQPRPSQARHEDNAALPHADEPVVVHLRDARSGELDIFAGTSQTRLRDRDLAARLIRAIR